MLDEAEARVQKAGIAEVVKRQRHDNLTDSLLALEKETRLFVMGLHGESSSDRDIHIGSQLETVIRKRSPPDSAGARRIYPAEERHVGL